MPRQKHPTGRLPADTAPTSEPKQFGGRERSGNQFMLHIEPLTAGQVSDAQRAMTLLAQRHAVPFADTVEVWQMLGLDRRAS